MMKTGAAMQLALMAVVAVAAYLVVREIGKQSLLIIPILILTRRPIIQITVNKR